MIARRIPVNLRKFLLEENAKDVFFNKKNVKIAEMNARHSTNTILDHIVITLVIKLIGAGLSDIHMQSRIYLEKIMWQKRFLPG